MFEVIFNLERKLNSQKLSKVSKKSLLLELTKYTKFDFLFNILSPSTAKKYLPSEEKQG